MGEANAKTPVRGDLGERKIRRIDIEITFYQLQVRRDLAKELESVAIRQISQTEDLADFTGREEFPELGEKLIQQQRSAVRDSHSTPWLVDPGKSQRPCSFTGTNKPTKPPLTGALSGMNRSPMTRTRREAILNHSRGQLSIKARGDGERGIGRPGLKLLTVDESKLAGRSRDPI